MFPEEVEYYIAESNGVQIDGEDIVLDDFLLATFFVRKPVGHVVYNTVR